ncbi:MAG: hypothetical protein V4539_10980 [Bacteroidota bacterium]
MKEVIKRASSPTPSFFVKLRNIGLGLASVSAAILTAPVTLPGAIITVAGYAAVIGSVIGAVSQLVKKEE